MLEVWKRDEPLKGVPSAYSVVHAMASPLGRGIQPSAPQPKRKQEPKPPASKPTHQTGRPGSSQPPILIVRTPKPTRCRTIRQPLPPAAAPAAISSLPEPEIVLDVEEDLRSETSADFNQQPFQPVPMRALPTPQQQQSSNAGVPPNDARPPPSVQLPATPHMNNTGASLPPSTPQQQAWSNATTTYPQQNQQIFQQQPVPPYGHVQQQYALPPHPFHHQQQLQQFQPFPMQHQQSFQHQPQCSYQPPHGASPAPGGFHYGAPMMNSGAGSSSMQSVTPDSERAIAKSIRMLSSAQLLEQTAARAMQLAGLELELENKKRYQKRKLHM